MKFPKFFLILAVLFLLPLGIAAQTTAVTSQRKAITAEEFEKIDAKAKQILTVVSYRITRTTESVYDKGKQNSVVKRVEEYVPPDRKHVLSETNRNGQFSKFEWIRIGERQFERKDSRAWEKSPANRQYMSGREDPVIRAEYFSEGTTTIDGKKAEVFVVAKSTKPPIKDPKFLCTDELTYFYGSEGRLFKMLRGLRCGDDDFRTTELYDYDLTIKIEAPIK